MNKNITGETRSRSHRFFRAMEPPSKRAIHLGVRNKKIESISSCPEWTAYGHNRYPGNRQFRNRTAALDIASFSKNNILYPALWERRAALYQIIPYYCRASCGDGSRQWMLRTRKLVSEPFVRSLLYHSSVIFGRKKSDSDENSELIKG